MKTNYVNSRGAILLLLFFGLFSSSNIFAQYCTPTKINTYNTNYISNVKFAGINNASSGTTGGYTYYSSISATNIKVGETFTGTVSVTIDGWNTDANKLIVWMNFNENTDDDFQDSGEEFSFTVQDGTNVSGIKVINVPISIPVPASANLGLSRIRIGFKTADNRTYTSCDFKNVAGEIEDYQINLTTSSTDTLPGTTPTNGDHAATYCTPSEMGNFNVNYISKVTLGSINKTTTGTTGAYSDYTSSQSTDITQGETISGSVTVTLNGWNTDTNSVIVWMNFNESTHNNFNESTERFVFSAKSTSNVSGNKTLVVPISIPVPNTAEIGLSRMRVAFRTSSNNSYTSCLFGYASGEIEDYKINIIPKIIDTDGDGIEDSVDLDNDNDGILDSEENNILSYGGFENVPVTSNGNNQAAQGVNANTILPWILIPGEFGSGGTPNVVRVNGGAYNYGNGGPPFDANPNTNTVEFNQHYFDINGNADIYQTFTVTSTNNITFSGYFSPRDNNNTATAKISIYSGVGNNKMGATLIKDTGTIALPVQNGSSAKTPWTLVQGTVTLSPGTYSYVVTMSDYSNFDEGSVKVSNSNLDSDGDGIANIYDLDSDNDGILDAEEAGHGKTHTNGVVNGSVGTDGIPDAVQASPNSGTVNYVVKESLDDADYIPNYLDLDSDGDGIPDNIEAQNTIGYVAPSGSVDSKGVDSNYATGLVPVNTDGTDNPDYLDLDSDNEGGNDTIEAGLTLAGKDSDFDGLDDNTDITSGYADVNGNINNPSLLPDADGDVNSGGDVDFRDAVFTMLNVPEVANLYFDGNDDYLSGAGFIKGLNDVTIMAWVKSDSGNSKDMTIAGEDVACKIWLKNGNIPMFTISTTKVSNKKVGDCSSCSINFDEWHHIAGSFSSTTGVLKLYIDGKLVDSNSTYNGYAIAQSSEANNTFEIGRFSNKSKNNDYFKGEVDEVRVFNKELTDSQIQQMIYQEIENNNGNVKGSVIAKDIADTATGSIMLWENLIAYYPMTSIKNNKTTDYSGNNRSLTLYNIGTVMEQTAPMPYITGFDGNWESANIWLHGDVWDIENTTATKEYGIVKISNNITVNSSIKTVGLIIDNNKTLTVTGDNEIRNSWYLELNGTLDLLNDSQLIQTSTSDLVTSAEGKLLRRQEGTSNKYRYNYWSSPIGTKKATSLTDNNTASNNANNTPFKLNMIKNEIGTNFQFTSAYDQVGKISTVWLYTYKNGLTYWDWKSLTTSADLNPGVGYSQKGTGNAGLEQQYIFEGKPNNGTILVSVTDKGGPGSVASVSKTEYLLGNPYPSALDIHKFIDDNAGIIDGSLLIWQQWAGDSHYLDQYKGGYAQVNKLGSVRASQFVGLSGASTGNQEGTEKPSRYLPIGQAFMTEIIASGNVVFNNSQRVFIKEADADGTYSRGSTFLKSTGSKSKSTTGTETAKTEQTGDMKKIRLEFNSIVGPKMRRELVLGFSETTSDGYDYGYDSECFDGSTNDFNLNFEGKNMNMQAYGAIKSDKVVSLNFKSSANNTFEISATEFENMDADQEVYLRDNTTGTYFNLRQNTAYRFTSAQGKFNTRFEIVFQSKQQSLSAEEIATAQNFIYYQNTTNTLYGKKLSASIDKLAIVNMRGQIVQEFGNVSQETLNSGLKLVNLSAGAYVAWFRSQTGEVITKKIIVN
ncbi:LamG-like jellyroll fold domain-containing protein [Mariniflexile gromovii]|uniref:LamG domain-containing protein n=1 Tax=Mariniflexile gromovii TaxID=362523 RepID=A0ABS4BQ82_9FLAO|nr:LamG domain-containing protein [Mariniflexile gromovii]MBP0902731.1 LamG domain-containing protein [Mariniflexile gromovii]